MKIPGIDFNKLSKDKLTAFKTCMTAYKQGAIDTGLAIAEYVESFIEKTVKLYDEQIKEIDEILGKD